MGQERSRGVQALRSRHFAASRVRSAKGDGGSSVASTGEIMTGIPVVVADDCTPRSARQVRENTMAQRAAQILTLWALLPLSPAAAHAQPAKVYVEGGPKALAAEVVTLLRGLPDV